MSNSDLTQTVVDIGNINLSGNTVPREWYKHILFDNGMADRLGIDLLAEIVFLYRPTRLRNEGDSEIHYKKKFRSDLLQKSYAELAEAFGASKRQVTDAIVRLEKLGLVTRVFRTIEASGLKGMLLYNVLFIDLHADAVRKITDLGKNLASTPSSPLPHPNVTPPVSKRETYTENTTYINKKYNKKILEEGFKRFWEAYPKRVAKEAARKAFEKAMKKTDIETIVKSLKLYTAKQDANFYANPATWLNGDQWLDEYKGEFKSTVPVETSGFKKRYGVDKLICDKIKESKGNAWFKSYIEENNGMFSESEEGELKLSISTKFSSEIVISDCSDILENLGYDFVAREITG